MERKKLKNAAFLPAALGICAASAGLTALFFFGGAFLGEVSAPREMTQGIGEFYIYIPIFLPFAALFFVRRFKAARGAAWLFVSGAVFALYASITAFNMRAVLYNPIVQFFAEVLQKSIMFDATSQRTVQNFAGLLNFVVKAVLVGLSGGIAVYHLKRYTVLSKDLRPVAGLFGLGIAAAVCAYFLLKLLAESFGLSAVFYCIALLTAAVSLAVFALSKRVSAV
ncbi:MAG: hypothetical protein LBP62_07095 [Clostridiales bacterium]|jgi:hypothetical protein|nr:hypothetical protein [Clostridiales bacterium]